MKDLPAPDSPTAAAASGIAIREDGTVLADGRPLALSPTELALLRALVAAGGRALSRREILFAMHGGPGNVREESLNFTVHALRAKLGRHWPSLRTVWGRGYAWQPATVSDLRRRLRRRIVLASTTALAVLVSFGAFVAVEILSLRPKPMTFHGTRDRSCITMRVPVAAISTDLTGAPGHESELAVDGDPATWYESRQPALFDWPLLRVYWKKERRGRVSVLLGRPDEAPPFVPAVVEVCTNGAGWRLAAKIDATTNAAVFEVSEPFRVLSIRPVADSDKPFAVREVSAEVDPAEAF